MLKALKYTIVVFLLKMMLLGFVVIAVISALFHVTSAVEEVFDDAVDTVREWFTWDNDIDFAPLANEWKKNVPGLTDDMDQLLEANHVGIPSSLLFSIYEMSSYIDSEEDVKKIAKILEPQDIEIVTITYNTPVVKDGKTVNDKASKMVLKSLLTYEGKVTFYYDENGLFDRKEVDSDYSKLDKALREAGLSIRDDEKEFLFSLAKLDDPTYVPSAMEGMSDNYDHVVIPNDGGMLQWPVPSVKVLSSTFGYRIDPITGEKGDLHKGIDVPAKQGTLVVAAESGEVVAASYGWNGGQGNYIDIKLDREGYTLTYMHLMPKGILVKKGDRVKRGDPIGKIGTTGSSTGNHLHFQLEYKGKAIDPMRYFNQ